MARQQQEAAAAEAVAAAVAAQVTAEQASAAAARSLLPGGTMRYEEVSVDVDEVLIDDSIPSKIGTVAIPGQFGTALGLVATTYIGRRVDRDPHDVDAYVWWWLATSLDGDYWHALAPAGGTSARVLSERTTSSLRIHGPFADRLSLKYCISPSNSAAYPQRQGRWTHLRVRLGVQFVD